MDRKILHIRIAVATTVGAIVLSAAACGEELSAHENQELTVLIGPNGSDETDAVRDAVRRWAAHSSYDATVAVAADIPGQLSEGFSSGDPADIFVLDTNHFSQYTEQGFLLVYGDDLPHAEDFHPASADNFTVDGQLVCAPKGSGTVARLGGARTWKVTDAHSDGSPLAEATLHDAVVPRQQETIAPSSPRSSECWGVAAGTHDPDAAVDLVRHLMSAERQVAAPLNRVRHRQ